MVYYFLVLLIFISLLLNGSLGYYDFFKIDLYLFLIPIIILKILLNTIKNKFVISKPIFYFSLFMFTIFFSLLINNGYEENNLDFFKSLKGTFSYSTWPLIFLLSATENISKKDSIRFNKLLWVIGYVMAANTIIPVIIYFLTGNLIGEFIVQDGSIRSFGFLSDQVGFALVYFIILSIFEKKYFIVLLFIASILVTGTRGAIVFAFIALIYSFISQNNYDVYLKNLSNVIKRGAVILFILSIAWISFGETIGNVILLRFDGESIEGTSWQRIGAAQAGVTLFLENPFFGVGFGKFKELVYNNSDLSNKFDYHSTLTKEENMRGYANAQNEFANILVNGGLFSLVAVILFIYNVLKNIRLKIRLMDNPRYYMVAFIFLISAFFVIQTAVYIFNPGITSFFILILLGRGSSKSLY